MPFILSEYLSLIFILKPGKLFNSFETAHSKLQIQIDLGLYLLLSICPVSLANVIHCLFLDPIQKSWEG